MTKIAFTYQNHREITAHAGKTSRYLIYTLDNSKNVTGKDVIELAKEDILHKRFHEAIDPYAPHPIFEVDFVITGGAGQGFVNRLALQGVKVFITTEKDPEQALDLFLKQKLPVRNPHNHGHH